MPLKTTLCLGDLAYCVKDSCNCSEATLETYVSTESLLPNKGGIVPPESIPQSGSINKYKPGDILISNIRPYFKKIWKADRSGTCSNDVLVVRSYDDNLADYLYALLLDDRFFDYVMLSSKGTKMPRGDRNQIFLYPVQEKTLAEMLIIGKIIRAINSKIALNQSINDNLLIQCKTQYHQLLMKSENTVLLSDIAEVCYGKDHKHLKDGDIPVYGSGGIMRYAEKSLYAGKESVLIPRKGTLNNIMYVREPFWSVDTMFYTRMKNEGVGKYLYFFLSEYDLAGMNIGSAVPSMTTELLNNIEIPYPGNNTLKTFNQDIQPIFDQIWLNKKECTCLESLRNTLLPKLLSGEIDVSALGDSQLNNHLLAELILMENLSILLKSKLVGKIDDDSIAIVISELTQILRECPVESDNSDPESRNNDLLNSFLSAKRLEGCSEKTISYYQSTLQMFLATSECDIISVTTDYIRNYLSEYQSKRGSGKITIDNIRRIFSSFFSWLEDEEYILKSPVRRIHKVKFGRTVKETFTDEELERMRDSCDSIRNLSILDTFISTGMRVGELVRLNISDVDFSGRECVVFGKGDCERRVYFDARTKLHLQTYLEHRADGNPALFVTQHKPIRRISINGVESMLKALGNGAGIKDVHPHKFRRTMATRAIDKGMPIEQVQKLLGHVRIDTTLHYAMVNQENVKNAHRKYVA